VSNKSQDISTKQLNIFPAQESLSVSH